jgi:hypothetical protein
MGIAQAGLVFTRTVAMDDLRTTVSNLFQETATEIEHPNTGAFDIRNHGDVMVQVFGDVCFICNNDLVWDMLEDHQKDASALYQTLGSPDRILLFCHYESGGSFGYAFIENGIRTRSRLQTTEVPPVIESGTPTALENAWLSAQFYFEEDDGPIEEREKIYYKGDRELEVSEDWITAQMLYETLHRQFSVCPWYTDLEPEYHFFRLSKVE